ncbi:MAG: class I SAM-dependent methyltransferase [Deltaproteobacteria bacterium]|nr:class I SAM-dependent methyltransferase [Deltaproteobacteria bacterium]
MIIRRLKNIIFILRSLWLSALRSLRFLIKGRTRDRYCIKAFYIPQQVHINFIDTAYTDEYQDEVYAATKRFADSNNYSRLLDIGCGSGFKLMKYYNNFDFIGLEIPPTLDFVKKKYPGRRWELCDFTSPPKDAFDLAICVDVIEHLVDPDELMRFLSRIEWKYLFLSTPARDRLGIESRIGPPANKYHMREWSRKEFVDYVSLFFNVIESRIVSRHDHYCIVVKKDANGSPS